MTEMADDRNVISVPSQSGALVAFRGTPEQISLEDDEEKEGP